MNHKLLTAIMKEAGRAVRKKVYASLQTTSAEKLSSVHSEKQEDTIYAIDREVEDVLVPVFEKHAKQAGGIVLLAEGIGDTDDPLVFPSTMDPLEAAVRIIVDPIDGTRSIMYNKRPAFFLAGAAPNKNNKTTLADIEAAVMVEIPTTKQFKADVLWAIKDKGAHCETENFLNDESVETMIRPSAAKTIIGGFAQLARFFPPGRSILSAIEDELIQTLAPGDIHGKAIVFEDQYICSGGQLYEMLMGHDRFIADVRGLLYAYLKTQGKSGGHVCHPYDVCAHLIGQESGLIITDGYGKTLNAPMDLQSEINWIGYANPSIHAQVEPVLFQLFKKYALVS